MRKLTIAQTDGHPPKSFYSEKCRSRTAPECTVFYFRLFCEIFGAFDRRVHSFHRQKSGQVSRVRRNHYQCEKPPHASYYSGRHSPKTKRETEVKNSFVYKTTITLAKKEPNTMQRFRFYNQNTRTYRTPSKRGEWGEIRRIYGDRPS